MKRTTLAIPPAGPTAIQLWDDRLRRGAPTPKEILHQTRSASCGSKRFSPQTNGLIRSISESLSKHTDRITDGTDLFELSSIHLPVRAVSSAANVHHNAGVF
jgi:hypothetical protein